MSINPRLPCGRFACHASVAIVASICSSIREIQRAVGASNWLVLAVCEERGIRPPKAIQSPKLSSTSAVRAAWGNTSAPGPAMAMKVGMSVGALRRRAKALGLPPRASGIRFSNRVAWPDDFDEMWVAGVLVEEIAKACVPNTVWPETICRQAKRRKLPKRTGGAQKKNGISLIQFRMIQEAKRMNAATKAAWRMAA